MPLALARLPLPQAVAVALFSLWPLVNLLARQSAPVVALVAALVLLWAVLAGQGAGVLKPAIGGLLRAPEVWLLLLLLALIWLGTRTSPVPKRAVLAAGQMSFALGVGLALVLGARALSSPAAARAAIAAALIGTPALVVMIRFWDPLHALFGIRDMITHTNRTGLLLAMLLPVTVFWACRRRGSAAAALLGAAMTGAVFYSYSESAKLAVLVVVCAALLHRLAGARAVWLAGSLAALVVLAAPLIGLHIFDLIPGWLFRHTSQSTFGIRGEIWREFSALALQKPWFGWGVEASFAPLQGLDRAAFSEAQRRVLEIGHTHNAPLQIWYEMGLAGALVSAALVLAATARIARMADGGARAVAFALAVAAFAVSTVSHGAWQVWWYCLAALVAVLAPGLRSAADDAG